MEQEPKKPQRKRRKFSDEFKRDAVDLVRKTDRSIAVVADELGVYDSTLGNWVRRAEIEDGEREGLTADERGRMCEIEAENAQPRRQNETCSNEPWPSG